MENNIITKKEAIAIREINGQPTMSSLRIAEVTGKDHKDVLRSIRNIFSECEIGESKFASSYLSEQNKEITHYLLPEQEFNLVISGYSAKYRLQLIKELMSYRKKALDSYLLDNPVDRAKAWIVEQEKLQIETKKRKHAEEKRNRLIHQNKSYTATELAHELGFKSAISFNRMLYKDKVITY
jgi:Rha family phage regulatory protein